MAAEVNNSNPCQTLIDLVAQAKCSTPNDGPVYLTNGSRLVVAPGTVLVAAPGDIFVAAGVEAEILDLESREMFILKERWMGENLTGELNWQVRKARR